MVVDSSAVLAFLLGEPDGDLYLEALASPERKLMSSLNHLEAAIVMEARKGPKGAAALSSLLVNAAIEILPFDASQSEIALAAWRSFGKGNHPAALNLGDCAAYALAATLNESLLCKGQDFPKTDIVLYPI